MTSLYPADIQYTKEHEWIRNQPQAEAAIGITAFAIDQLGDVVHLELPKVGEAFKAGETFGTIESTKTVSDLYMPVSGSVVAVNSDLLDAPEKIAEDPHNSCWLIRIRVQDTAGSQLLSAEDYQKYIHEAANQ